TFGAVGRRLIVTLRAGSQSPPARRKGNPVLSFFNTGGWGRKGGPTGRRPCRDVARGGARGWKARYFPSHPRLAIPAAKFAGEMPCLTGTLQIIEQNQGFGPEKHVASVANRYQAISRGYDWLALAPCDKDATCGTVCCVLEK